MIIMDTLRGYIFRVKHGKFYEVSSRLTKLQPLGFVIKEILYAKAIIVKTLDLINNDKLNRLYNNDDDYDDTENNSENLETSHLFHLLFLKRSPHQKFLRLKNDFFPVLECMLYCYCFTIKSVTNLRFLHK